MISLILGAEGMVGHALARKIPNAILGTHRDMDITDYEVMFKVFSKHRPDIVYLPAGITNVDKCESSKTDKINVQGALQIARLCDMFGSKLIYYSSSYVFSSIGKLYVDVAHKENEEPHPLQNYGEQKKIVETFLQRGNINCVIIRTVGVFGEGTKNFVHQVVRAIQKKKKFQAPHDQFMNPILVSDLVDISIVLAFKHSGIFHVAGSECMSKYRFAMYVAEYFGKEKLIEPVASNQLHQIAHRPTQGCLDCSKLTTIGLSIPSFSDGLHRYLSAEYG